MNQMKDDKFFDVYFYEAFEEEAAALKRFLGGEIKAGFTWKTIQEQGDLNPPAKLISIRTQSVIPPEWSKTLSGILTRSTGYNHLIEYKQQTGVELPCGYLPLYCHRSVAEQAMLLWMTLLRKLARQIKQFAKFKRDGLTGFECQNKTLLVVGVGNIGYEAVKIGKGLGMNALGVDIAPKHDDVNYVKISDGIKQADVIVCAMNLTKDNVKYFNYDLLKKAKSGVVFINVARGELSSPLDLLRLLDEQHLGGAALDVFDNESELAVALRKGQTSDEPNVKAVLKMAEYDNVVLTPHNAFNTAESVERKSEQSVQQTDHFIAYNKFLWDIPAE